MKVWQRYSKKLLARIQQPKNAGMFTPYEASEKRMRLVVGKSVAHGQMFHLYLLVDEEDGVIADAKFQAFGTTALIGASDAICEILLRKNYDQAKRISAELIEHFLRDKPDKAALPEDASNCLNLLLDAIDDAADQCLDIPFAETYFAPPIPGAPIEMTPEGIYPGWEKLGVEQKIALLEQVIANDIRPYIELDAGGIKILKFENDRELVIAYEGSCTSCYSATGATLNAIQQILRAKVHPEIVVVPDMSFLNI